MTPEYITRLVTDEIATREALDNWLRPGVIVRCVAIELVTAGIVKHVAMGRLPLEALAFNLTIPHKVSRVTHADENPRWRYMMFEGYDNFSLAPELSDGTVMWEPVE